MANQDSTPRVETIQARRTRRDLVFPLLAILLATSLHAFPAEPALKVSDIVSAADHRGGAISPGEIVILYAANAGPATLIGQTLDPSGRVMTTLGETRVLFDGQAAPLIYALQGEIGAVVPFEVEGHPSSSVVVEYRGQQSAAVTIPVVPSKPAIFTQNRVGTGPAGILNDSGCCNSAANPAARGTWATLYATGTGVYEDGFSTGSVAAYPTPGGYPRPSQRVRLTVGGVPAELSFVAAAPHNVAGLLQVNFRVPDNAPIGTAELLLSVGDSESTALATMSVRSAKTRILLASLEPVARKQWAARLLAAGYEVVDAAGLGAATALAATQPIDLAILALPPAGPSPAAWITGLAPASPGMKILVIAAASDPDSLRVADSLGANAVVERTTASALVMQRIQELVQRRHVIYDAGPPWPLPPVSR